MGYIVVALSEYFLSLLYALYRLLVVPVNFYRLVSIDIVKECVGKLVCTLEEGK